MTRSTNHLSRCAATDLRAAILFMLIIALALLTPSPASAHTELVDSTPKEGARLVAAPASISLEFSQAVDPSFAAMVVSVDGDKPVRLEVSAGDSSSIVSAIVPTSISSTAEVTEWRVDYRVTSVDGHPIVGDISFSVAAVAPSGDQSPPPELEPHSTPPEAAEVAEGSGSAWVLVGGALMLLVLVVPAGLVLARRRRDHARLSRGEQQ
ncbi:copper resistance CopC family protein [Nocardioides terrigena]|uniref:copper resistance CopC family protein n=1 Tax=Nocardioides terrigena TaxID=424797 RepID=UPI00131F0DE4|nr:copper resistance CopC family protein [Nocardioides terrigena]